MLSKSDKRPSTRRRKRSLTPKGVKTRRALLESARQVFESEGYFGASVSEIGRRCGVSQGTFYQYFRNKEQVFRELIDSVLFEFWSQAERVPLDAENQDRTFRAVLELLLRHCRKYDALHRVLNEFELIETVTISYYDSIARYCRDFFRRAASLRHFRALDPNVIAYSLLGMAAFQQRDLGLGLKACTLDELIDLTAEFLELGISGPKAWKASADLEAPSFDRNQDSQLHWEEAVAPGKRTRREIFQAAEQVLGDRGYNRAGISEITRRAGVAQGTFYVHFQSKEELMNGVVRFLSRELRRELRRATDKVRDRRDKEIQGMAAFFSFLGRHSPIYRIVSESEVIVPASAEYYYCKLAEGYAASLAIGLDRGEIRDQRIDFMTASLMGISHMLGLRWLVWNSAPHPEIPKQVFADAMDLILFGLKPRP